MTTDRWALLLSAPDRPGILADVTRSLAQLGGNIEDAEQHHDQAEGRFFQRLEFTLPAERDDLASAFAPLAQRWSMTTELHPIGPRVKVAVLASRARHCLADLLVRAHTDELPITVTSVVANHDDIGELPVRFDVPFTHLPHDTPDHDEHLRRALDDAGAELVVLARYMRIVSPSVVDAYRYRMINIHHSFLPAFPGASPYAQAHARGVKLIGATAHYVTETLDDGPIIAQGTVDVSHRDDIADLTAKGRDLEVLVLAQAVAAHVERRVLTSGRRTVVFGS